ncbi:MAG: hypothetical protein NTW40_01230, partial [Acidobacteria bacterium]|nr:hypothetical protein [Acidobacteriota bacterium]
MDKAGAWAEGGPRWKVCGAGCRSAVGPEGQDKAPLEGARGIQALEALAEHRQALLQPLEGAQGGRSQTALGLAHPGQVGLPGHPASGVEEALAQQGRPGSGGIQAPNGMGQGQA